MMRTAIKTRIIKIGNSRGIRIPKVLLEQLHFGEEVELELSEGAIQIRPPQHPRAGWAEQFAAMAAQGDDRLLDEELLLTEIEEKEWEW
jgi:antitoxin MazE